MQMSEAISEMVARDLVCSDESRSRVALVWDWE